MGTGKNFTGFKPEAIQFLNNLGMDNTKAWFEDHRADYTEYLLEPMKNLVIDLTGAMHSIDPGFETRPLVDKTISRIYRDVRFSRDKSPYRTNMWIVFKRRVTDWKDYPAFSAWLQRIRSRPSWPVAFYYGSRLSERYNSDGLLRSA